MHPVTSPLRPGDEGGEVASLQAGLTLLLNKQVIQADPDTRTELLNILAQESQAQVYRDATQRLVAMFQEQRHLNKDGIVNDQTAAALNEALRSLGAFDDGNTARPQRTVAGQVVQGDGTPFGSRVILVEENAAGSLRLGEDSTDPEGRYAITYAPLDGTDGVKLRVAAFDGDGQRRAEATIEASQPVEVANLVVQGDGRAFRVTGRLSSGSRAGVGGLRVAIADKEVGGDTALAETATGPDGTYRLGFTYSGQKTRPDLQARAFSGETPLGVSEVRYNAANDETLNIAVPDDAQAGLATEYETLTGDIAAHYTGSLRDLQETGDRQDVTYLANKTGWDARAVALASLADQFSARTADPAGAPAIHPALFYALFRAGLPTDEDSLLRTRPDDLRRVWSDVVTEGLIPADAAANLPAVVERFQAIAAERTLSGPPATGVSTLRELLSVAELSDAAQQTQFANLYLANQEDPRKLWDAVGDALGPQTAEKLQLHGKLAALTVNNAPLIRAVSAVVGDGRLRDPAELALTGFHRAEKWDELLGEQVPIPAEVPGDTPQAQRANYASHLAAQVRLNYPTASMAHLVQSGALNVPAAQGVAAFLADNQHGFDIGSQPVEQFIARANLQTPPETVASVKTMQRVLQITSSDESMSALVSSGITSAYQIARQDQESFVAAHTQALGADEAARVYDRSREIHNATLNVAMTYLTARNGFQFGAEQTPGAGGAGAADSGQILRPQPQGPSAANADDIIAYPTLEQLFGSMDFCSCDECRSIFSPAAYLVDLLQFLDNAADGKRNAQDVLFERRPDIQHLPLTCENTNTPLPYIDIVNETLEYYVANAVRPLSLDQYEGHDTGSVATEDLMASPQYVLDTAYDTVRGAVFPAPLPFHQPLENTRLLFDAFEVPLELAMERLRPSDDVERGAGSYGWRDILMEAAGFSREEYNVLTDSSAGLKALYGFPVATADSDVADTLSNAKQYCRRVTISYEDLVALLETHFVNPNSDLVPQLERLGVSFSVLAALHDETMTDAAFDAMLPAGAARPDPAKYGGDIKAWAKNDANFARIMAIIVLEDPAERAPAEGCTFDRFELRYSRPLAAPGDTSTRLTTPDLFRLLRFIRVWRTTGWTIGQTDAALCALYNADLSPVTPGDVSTLADLDAGFARFVPRLGNVVRAMDALNLSVKRDLVSLLACWAPMQTAGSASLYRTLLLNAAVTHQDPAFQDDGSGHVPRNPAEKLADLRETLRGALTLTADEFDRIFAALGFDDNTPATVANITAMYRRGWLARRLRLSVREFLLLTSLTGLDPFAPPDPPQSPMLRLAALVQSMRTRGLKSAAALYLVWNQDLTGKSMPGPDLLDGTARSLRADFAAVDDQFAVVEDPGGDVARARMALVYGQETADAYFSLVEGTVVLNARYAQAAEALDPAILAADADARLSWDRFRDVLSHRGLLDAATRDKLKAVPGVSAAFTDAVDALFARGQDVSGSFFARFPELKPLYDAWVTSAGTPAQKRSAFLAAFSPALARIRKRQQALQRMATAAVVDVAFAQTILDPAQAPYPVRSAADESSPALDDVVALGTEGLAARFYFRDTATGAVDKEFASAGDLSYSATNPLPANPAPGAAISGVWQGRVEAPESGFFNIVVTSDPSSTVSLSFDGQTQPLVRFGAVSRNANPLELRAGNLYDVSIVVEKVVELVDISWESPRRSREAIPAHYLYPASVFPPFHDTFLRFLKIAALASALKLTAGETAFFSDGGWLNTLAVTGDPPPADAPALLDRLERLLDFARVKNDVSPDDEQLLAILKDPAAATAKPDSPLFALTHWDKSSLDDLLAHFGAGIAGLSGFALFRRVYDAFAVLQKLGLPTSAAIQATTNAPAGTVAGSFSAALRARYDASSWRDVVRPINDQLRSMQRDALVAYILHQLRSVPSTAHIDTPDKLFEYFLMDVQMDPCMQTSRIRHALSAVQLFAERCLMNLEAQVSPGSINATRWAWMKRFRVWQVPRELFTYPENWMEPELRDDKTPIFKEIESQLLQSDIDEDTAADALRTYLTRLEEVARLEPCGMHYVEPTATTDDAVHLIARTQGARRTYYYRRYEHGVWSPWEPVKLDIADNPVVPVLWRDRLLLFHARLLTKNPDAAQRPTGGNLIEMKTSDIPGDPVHTRQAVLCWSEYHNGSWQPVKTSDLQVPADISEGRLAYLITSSEIKWKVLARSAPLQIVFDTDKTPAFVMHDTHGSPTVDDSATPPQPPRRRFFDQHPDFGIWYRSADGNWVSHGLVHAETGPSVVEPAHELDDTWDAPFFFADNRHVFLVSTQSSYWPLSDTGGFGVNFGSVLNAPSRIPPLVLELPPDVPPKPWEKVQTDLGRVVDPAPMRRYITEDAYIRKGMSVGGNVIFNGTLIGPSGRVSGVPRNG